MRILFLAHKAEYLNPTRGLFVDGFARRPDVVRVGPGYGPLPETIAEMARQAGGRFDAVVVDSLLYSWHGEPQQRTVTGLDHDFWPRDLFESGIPTVILNMMADLQGAPRAWWDRYLASGFWMANPSSSPQFYRHQTPDRIARESWLEPGIPFLDPSVVTERMLMLPHCLETTEFLEIPAKRKSLDVAVMGADYWFRRRTREWCKTTGHSCQSMMNPLNRLVTDYLLRYGGIFERMWRDRFVRFVRAAHVAVTCDATIGYPLRKFFEIPAFGAPLAALFFRDPEALGFVDGETCFHLDPDRMDRIADLVRASRAGDETMRRVARDGQEMVRQRHTVDVRAAQLAAICEAAATGTLRGTVWRGGRMHVVRDDATLSGPV